MINKIKAFSSWLAKIEAYEEIVKKLAEEVVRLESENQELKQNRKTLTKALETYEYQNWIDGK